MGSIIGHNRIVVAYAEEYRKEKGAADNDLNLIEERVHFSKG